MWYFIAYKRKTNQLHSNWQNHYRKLGLTRKQKRSTNLFSSFQNRKKNKTKPNETKNSEVYSTFSEKSQCQCRSFYETHCVIQCIMSEFITNSFQFNSIAIELWQIWFEVKIIITGRQLISLCGSFGSLRFLCSIIAIVVLSVTVWDDDDYEVCCWCQIKMSANLVWAAIWMAPTKIYRPFTHF